MSKQSQKRTKRAALREASESSTPASTIGWLATMPTVRPSMRREAGDDVLGERVLDLEEVALVHDLQDQLLDVVGLVGIVGDQRVERRLGAVRGGRAVGSSGTPDWLLEGRKSISRRICSSVSTSFS